MDTTVSTNGRDWGCDVALAPAIDLDFDPGFGVGSEFGFGFDDDVDADRVPDANG